MFATRLEESIRDICDCGYDFKMYYMNNEAGEMRIAFEISDHKGWSYSTSTFSYCGTEGGQGVPITFANVQRAMELEITEKFVIPKYIAAKLLGGAVFEAKIDAGIALVQYGQNIGGFYMFDGAEFRIFGRGYDVDDFVAKRMTQIAPLHKWFERE